MNLSFVIGNLGADAEVKTANGKSFISLSIADSRKYTTQDGKEMSEINWIDAIISNADHPVLPYLKQGVKVCVIGNASLRVYSSKKDRMMKAGLTIHVLSIELCGGSSDAVPRQLIEPETGRVLQTNKFYWISEEDIRPKVGENKMFIDARGNEFVMDSNGFVRPQPSEANSSDANSEAPSSTNETAKPSEAKSNDANPMAQTSAKKK